MHIAFPAFRVRALRPALVPFLAAALTLAPAARGAGTDEGAQASRRSQNATQWLERSANAARTLNYVGTIVYQHGGRVETSRLAHWAEGGQELEKLVSLDGAAREVIRSQGEVRCYYPDAKLVRVEPRTIRNVFPSLSAEQQLSLAKYYDFRRLGTSRVAGREAQLYSFEPKDGLRYGHQFWADVETGLLLKARLVSEQRDIVDQFAFMEISIGPKIDRELVKPTWPPVPPDWQVKEGSAGEMMPHDTGWTVTRLPPGFTKIMEGYRSLRGKRNPVAHLVYSDGLVAVSVFVEPLASSPAQGGALQQGAVNVYSMKLDDQMVTVLGEAPGATVRQIATSVAKR
jgi:sigma-E factor negative regulatory protein RseB